MKKKLALCGLIMGMSVMTSVTVFAGEWKQDNQGWWYQKDDGGWYSNGWQWIDGDRNGTSECYYFNKDGYCLVDTTTPDGYTVNANGAWVIDGIVQTQSAGSGSNRESNETVNYSYGQYSINPLVFEEMSITVGELFARNGRDIYIDGVVSRSVSEFDPEEQYEFDSMLYPGKNHTGDIWGNLSIVKGIYVEKYDYNHNGIIDDQDRETRSSIVERNKNTMNIDDYFAFLDTIEDFCLTRDRVIIDPTKKAVKVTGYGTSIFSGIDPDKKNFKKEEVVPIFKGMGAKNIKCIQHNTKKHPQTTYLTDTGIVTVLDGTRYEYGSYCEIEFDLGGLHFQTDEFKARGYWTVTRAE